MYELEERHSFPAHRGQKCEQWGLKEGEGGEREGHWPPNRRFFSCQRVIRRPDARETPFTIDGYVEDDLLLFS